MRLVFDSKAEGDLQNIARWIERDSPNAAVAIIGRIKVVCSNLLVFPSMGKESSEPGTREVVVAGLPYIIVYRIEEDVDQIVIAAVFHSAQDRGTG